MNHVIMANHMNSLITSSTTGPDLNEGWKAQIIISDFWVKFLAFGRCQDTLIFEKGSGHLPKSVVLGFGEKSRTLSTLHTYVPLRWYLTLQGDNSLKSVERFDHMFVCRFQASR